MKLNFTKVFFTAIASVMLLSCCTDPPPPEIPQDSHTLIMYMMGDTQDISSNLRNNVSDVISAVTAGIPDYGRIFLYYHGYSAEGALECYLAEVKSPSGKNSSAYQERIATYPATSNSVGRERINAVIAKVKEVAPSETYGMQFGSHATGWFPTGYGISSPRSPGVLPDGYNLQEEYDFTKPEGAMTRGFGPNPSGRVYGNIEEIVEGVKGADLEYILFDACFMSSIEALYDLRNSARYIYAYPVEIMLKGAPYKKIIPALFSRDANLSYADRLLNAANETYKYYNSGAAYPGYDDYKASAVTVTDCSKFTAFAQSVRNIFSSDTARDFDYSRINDKNYIQPFEGLTNKHAFFDLKDYIEKICGDPQLLAAFDNALDDLIYGKHIHTPYIYSAYNAGRVYLERSCGISTYIPQAVYPVFRTAYYNTAWAKFTQPDGWPY